VKEVVSSRSLRDDGPEAPSIVAVSGVNCCTNEFEAEVSDSESGHAARALDVTAARATERTWLE
jgi:hypothetical protein